MAWALAFFLLTLIRSLCACHIWARSSMTGIISNIKVTNCDWVLWMNLSSGRLRRRYSRYGCVFFGFRMESTRYELLKSLAKNHMVSKHENLFSEWIGGLNFRLIYSQLFCGSLHSLGWASCHENVIDARVKYLLAAVKWRTQPLRSHSLDASESIELATTCCCPATKSLWVTTCLDHFGIIYIIENTYKHTSTSTMHIYEFIVLWLGGVARLLAPLARHVTVI